MVWLHRGCQRIETVKSTIYRISTSGPDFSSEVACQRVDYWLPIWHRTGLGDSHRERVAESALCLLDGHESSEANEDGHQALDTCCRDGISASLPVKRPESPKRNPIQLEQVFINLLTNARDAMVDSPRKAIRISGSVGSEGVEVAVADSGFGILPGLERWIFDPFFTTKEVGQGTGLGLSITYVIVKEHGGTICSRAGPGSATRRPPEGG